MNERIVKLFMQSVDSNYIPLPIEDHIPSWTEKFAELIVRECCDIVNQEALHTDYIPAEMNQYVFKRLMKAFDKIEEHFGVEE